MAQELGITKVAMPTNGNAGAALAAYGTRAGMDSYIFCPDDTPTINVRKIAAQWAKVWRKDLSLPTTPQFFSTAPPDLNTNYHQPKTPWIARSLSNYQELG